MFRSIIVAGLLTTTAVAWPDSFLAPVKITDGTRKYRFSRTANHQMAVDSAGTLHVTYWSGRLIVSPAMPSAVYYRSWSAVLGWSPEMQVDDGVPGGRHSSLAVTAADTVWIAWHDHRHSTAVGSWIDNLEIYADFMPAGGAFSSSDLRLTMTSATHGGDNGYTPRLVAHASGRLSLAWYDYSLDPNISDIYLKTTDPTGAFDLTEPISSLRLTDLNSRGGGPEFTVPDLAVDLAETRHLVWAGGLGPDVDLYYAQMPLAAAASSEIVLASGATNFFDPPHVALAPDQNLWIAYADNTAPAGENVVLLRRRASEAGFDPPMALFSHPSRQVAPDLEIDSEGLVHLVWVDERAGTHVYYGVFDPAASSLVDEVRLTDESSSWARPTLLIRPSGVVYVLFEQSLGQAGGDIWFSTNFVSAARGWEAYR